MKTLVDYFAEASKDPTLGVHFSDPKGELAFISYQDLYEDAQNVARYFLEMDLNRNDIVLIVLPTGRHFYAAFFGVMLAGGIPAAVYPPFRLGGLDHWRNNTLAMMRKADSTKIITNKRISSVCQTLRKIDPKVKTFLIENLMKEHESYRPLIEPDDNDIAFVQFSSGSTGRPKPIAISQKACMVNIMSIIDGLKIPVKEMKAASWLPLYHDMGLVGGVLAPMVVKRPITLIRPEHFIGAPSLWFTVLTKTKANITMAPHFAFSLCAAKIEDEKLTEVDLSHLKVILCGAETLCTTVLGAFYAKFKKFGLLSTALTPVYGLAEATLAVTFSDVNSDFEEKRFNLDDPTDIYEDTEGRSIISLGKPLLGVEVQIRNANGKVLPAASLGEIWIKSPSLFSGYINGKKETEEVFRKGWLNTGDIGFLYDGNLFFSGRSKDIIIINGRNLDPSPMEQVVSNIKNIRKGAVAIFGVYSENTGSEKLVVCAEVSTRLKEEEEIHLRDEIKKQLARNFQTSVFNIQFLDKGMIPKTSSGKIMRNAVKQLWHGKSFEKKRMKMGDAFSILKNYFFSR